VTHSDAVCQRTFRLESLRATFTGILETAWGTFLLLIAVRCFNASANAKALVASGAGFGLLLTPFVVALVAKSGAPIAHAGSYVLALGGVGFILAAAAPGVWMYVAGAVLAPLCFSAVIPLHTQIYQDNYPEPLRGRLFSRTVIIRILAAGGFSYAAGHMLDIHLDLFRGLLLLFAAASFAAAFALRKIPSRPLVRSRGRHPLSGFRFLKTDRQFRVAIISWMFMGFANLMMLPMRIEYLANPRYGLVLGAAAIAMYTGVIPNIARLIMNPLWGVLFDKLNFFLLRIVLNVTFAIGILSFFTGGNKTGLILGALVYGIANAGGDVAWSLWVTKLAPTERVADYMAVHTFMTGIRQIAAPLVAFHVVNFTSLSTMGWVSAGLLLFASAMLIPEVRIYARRKAIPIAEGVSE